MELRPLRAGRVKTLVRFIITGILILPFLVVGCPFTKEETV